MKKLLINIFDKDTFQWIGLIEEVETLILNSSFSSIKNSELRVSKKAQSVNELKVGRLLVINGEFDKVQYIEGLETNLTEESILFTLIPLKAILKWRVIKDYGDNSKNLTQSYLMKNKVYKHATNSIDPKRNFPNLVVDTPTSASGYGALISYKDDWSNLAEVLTTMSHVSTYSIGWNIILKDDLTQMRFHTYNPTNRTINQSIVPPVIFSDEFDNVRDSQYIEDEKDFVSFCYVNSAAAESQAFLENAEGWNKREIYIEAKQEKDDITGSDGLRDAGLSEINSRPKINSFIAEIVDKANTFSTYNKDWFLGDIVTIQSKKILKDKLISIDVQISAIEEIYDGGEYSLNVTFGEGRVSVIQLIKNTMKQKK